MDALRAYGGTLVFVSHDRYFLDGLATKILEVGNQTAISYPGNYEDYLFKKEVLDKEASIESESEVSPAPQSSEKKLDDQPGTHKKKANPIKIRLIKEKIEGLEGKIHLHETRIEVLNKLLATEELYRDHQLFRSTMEEHDQLQQELNKLMNQWEEMHAELESLEQQ